MVRTLLNFPMAGTPYPRNHSNPELAPKMQQSNLGASVQADHEHEEGNIVHNQEMGAA
jgi:hypothetical protein